jgi:hypothetical protein
MDTLEDCVLGVYDTLRECKLQAEAEIVIGSQASGLVIYEVVPRFTVESNLKFVAVNSKPKKGKK